MGNFQRHLSFLAKHIIILYCLFKYLRDYFIKHRLDFLVDTRVCSNFSLEEHMSFNISFPSNFMVLVEDLITESLFA